MTRSVVCERVRAQVSLRLDGELSELERRMLESHLSRCAECSAYARDVETFTRLLGEAPLERPRFPVVVRRPRRASVGLMQVGGVAAAVAVVVLGFTAQFTGPRTSQRPSFEAPARYETRGELEREQQILAGGNTYDSGSGIPI